MDQVCAKTPHEFTWARYLYTGLCFSDLSGCWFATLWSFPGEIKNWSLEHEEQGEMGKKRPHTPDRWVAVLKSRGNLNMRGLSWAAAR